MKFIELKNILNETLGVEHLADIARELGVTPQAVSNWKSRDNVPYKYVKIVRNKLKNFDKDLDLNNTRHNTIKLNQNDNINMDTFREETISLSSILLVFARQLKLIIFVPIITCLFTIFYVTFVSQPVYVSTAKIMSSSGGGGSSQMQGIASQFGLNLPTASKEPEWIYPDIIKSRTLAKKMLSRKFTTNRFGVEKPLLEILVFKNGSSSTITDTLISEGADAVIRMIDIQQNGSSYKLTVSASEPLFARDFVIALIEELDNYQRDYNKSIKSETRKFIEERILQTKMELMLAEEKLKNFRDRNRRIQNSPNLLLEEQRLSRDASVLTGVYTTLKQQLETTKIEEVKDSDYVVVLDPPEAPLSRSKPRKKIMVILSGVFGLGVGLFLGLLREFFEKSNKDDKENFNKAKSIISNHINDVLPQRFRNKAF